MSFFSELSAERDWEELMEYIPEEPDYYPEMDIPYTEE